MEMLARWGFGARGVVYCLVGGLALLAATGSGGRTDGSRGALQTLFAQPFGKLWLALVAIGLLGFAAWRVLEALTDADHRGNGWKALGVRAAHLLGGGIYFSLAAFAAKLAWGLGGAAGRSDDAAARDWTAWLLQQPLGPWLVGLMGLGIAGGGAAFLWRGWRGNVTDRLALPAGVDRWAVPLGRIGFAARGVVFVLVGGFLVLAGVHHSSSQAHGLSGALASLQAQPYGWVLLGVVAAGLFAFGLFGLVQARYRHIDPPNVQDAKSAFATTVETLR